LPQRVAVFLDYQNVYMAARSAFFTPWAPHVDGQAHPRRLALKLKGVGDNDRELVAVRVYRGQPSSKHDPKGYGASDRQMALWRQQALVVPVSRPLNYRDPFSPKEKGIDVRIAIDFVMMAMRNQYDIGVLFSGDTDLLPALEAVVELKGPQACESAAWVPADGSSPIILRVPGHRIRHHRPTATDYGHVADPTDDTVRRRRR
jgi:uncharacterized LabA/DUF88 family protein